MTAGADHAGYTDRQGDLFRADHLHFEYVGRESFYAWLALEGPRHFRDEDFRDFYSERGRFSVPPSQLLTILLLQGYDGVSDQEAIGRSRYDLRWKVALGLGDHDKLCAKSTLQLFRGKLLLDERGRQILAKSVRVCRESGVLGSARVKAAAIDTTPIHGRGAVKDTFNLLADGIVKLLRGLLESLELEAEITKTLEALATECDLTRYVSPTSLKASRELEWDDRAQREEFLGELVMDVKRRQYDEEASRSG